MWILPPQPIPVPPTLTPRQVGKMNMQTDSEAEAKRAAQNRARKVRYYDRVYGSLSQAARAHCVSDQSVKRWADANREGWGWVE